MNEPIKVKDGSQPVKIVLGILGLLALGGIILTLGKVSQKFGSEVPLTVTVSNTSSTVGLTTAVKILVSAPEAQVRWCTNRGAQDLFLFFQSTSTGAASLKGYLLRPSSTLEMTADLGNLWKGEVWAITDAATTTVSCATL